MTRKFPSAPAIGQECQYLTGSITLAGGAITASSLSKMTANTSGTPGVINITFSDYWEEFCGLMSDLIEPVQTAYHTHVEAVTMAQPAPHISVFFSTDAAPTVPLLLDGVLHFTVALRGDIRQ